ncbi:hypothetical protein JHK85_001168 [Glycine max]|nr:hypothetical protein JHK87_001136 [Glycine soja]KAG5068791.1 hypothetical protein JHK85_001168 [Glycine max]KAG5088525.1 hypothetical protein JHK86_001137 [Glycine max]
MCLRLLSNASKKTLCVIGASFCIISLVTFNYSTRTWIANFECAVLPLGNNKDVMLENAIVNTISPCKRKAEANVFHMKVLPIPP